MSRKSRLINAVRVRSLPFVRVSIFRKLRVNLASVPSCEYNCNQSFVVDFRRRRTLACPFFMPTNQSEDIAWLHPSRLPLGAGWSGHCGAPGHEGSVPTPEEIKENCNLGYAIACPRLPEKRDCDAVRFSVLRRSDSRLVLWFVFESGHRPAGHGTLEYNVPTRQWTSPHPNERIQRMADCYIQAYLSRKAVLPVQAFRPATNPDLKD